MHSGGGYLSSKLESLTTGSPVHERRGHLNSQAVIFFRTRFPDPRSCTCISSPQPPATRPWHPSCAVRQRQDIRRPWLDSKVPSRTRVFSHIRYRHFPPPSQVTFAYAHQQSNVIHDSHPQGRNGKSRYDFDTATTGPSTSGMCHKSAHQVQRWCDLFLIKGYHWYHGTIVSPTPSFSMSGRPCPCRPKRPSCHRQPKRRHTPKRTSQLVSSKRLVHDAHRDLPRPRGLEDPWPCFLSARSRL